MGVAAEECGARAEDAIVSDAQQVPLDSIKARAWPEDAIAHAGAEEADDGGDTSPVVAHELVAAAEAPVPALLLLLVLLIH